jgi:hypothetical protein
VTVPVGAFAPVAALTVAVKVTDELIVMLFVEAEIEVVVSTVAAVTVTDTVADFDGLNVDVPAYAAVIVLFPTGKDDVLNVAVPEAS